MGVSYGGLQIASEELPRRGLVVGVGVGEALRIGDVFFIVERAYRPDGSGHGYRYRILAEKSVRIDRVSRREVQELLGVPEALRA